MTIDLGRMRPSLDALCLTALRQELEKHILGGAIQRVEVRNNELALEIYAHRARRRLYCHIGDDATRIHLTIQKSEPSTPVDSPLLLQIRKHVRGGRIVTITQPHLERILELGIATRDDGTVHTCALIIETMGRRSNAILVDSTGEILDALRRTPPSRSPNRPVLPHLPYVTPPAQERFDPSASGLAEHLSTAANEQTKVIPVSDLVGRNVAGFSPMAAREVTFRALGSLEVKTNEHPDWESVAASVRGLVAEIDAGHWQPHVAYVEGLAIAVSPYRPEQFQQFDNVEVRSFDLLSEALEAAFATGPARVRIARSAIDVVRNIRLAVELEQRREGALSREVADPDEIERLRLSGEAILASLGSLSPGAHQVEFNELIVPLNPPRSPVEVANEYFSDYRKRRDAAAQIPALREAANQRIEYLESLIAMAEASDVQSTHRQIQRELDAFKGDVSPVSTKKRRPQQEPQPRRHQSSDGFSILVGTNGAMNDRVTFKIAAPDDQWFHARGVPGAHVILRCGGQAPSSEAIQLAANLAAKFSRGRTSGAVAVDHTAVRNVRKIRGAPPGLVRYVQEETVIGRPDAMELGEQPHTTLERSQRKRQY
ncbi:MAG: NFACT family protein [Chloroflexota bacterium]